MTGPEHYREAERLLALAHYSANTFSAAAGAGAMPASEAMVAVNAAYAEAQVHATLAHAAADALVATATQAPHTTEAARDWREVLKPAEQTCPGGC